LFIKLMTDEGIVGLGERPTAQVGGLAPHIALIKDFCERYVVGEDPFHIEQIWQRIFALSHDFRHPSMHATPALSAIDIALGEIAGKAVNQPISSLLGGQFHERLPAYPSRGHDYVNDPEGVADAGRQLVADGWPACKLDPFIPVYPYPRDWHLRDI